MDRSETVRFDAGYAVWLKVVLVSGIVIGAIGGLALMRAYIATYDWIRLVAVGLAYTALLVSGLISLVRYRITATDKSLLRCEFQTKSLLFSSVTHLHFDATGVIIVKGAGMSIKLTGGIPNKDELFRFVVDKVKDNTNLKITGEEDRIIGYLGPDWKK